MKQPEASMAIQVLPKIPAEKQNGGDEIIRVVDAVIAYLKGTGLPVFVGTLKESGRLAGNASSFASGRRRRPFSPISRLSTIPGPGCGA
jgi:hypothetical protein